MSIDGFAADWPAPPGVRTWQTVRAGGVSSGPYSSMNLGDHVGDSADAVARNRGRLCDGLGLPNEPVWLEQVHGTRILDIDRGDSGPADGAVTSSPGQVLAVMTADCLPVLLASSDGQSIAVAHAGWRGLAGGVLARAVAAFDRPPASLLAWLGPAISQQCFEVGDEVRAAFVAADAEAGESFRSNERGRWQADLYELARRALASAGVTAIHGGESCTYRQPDKYFSNRREAPCGRMVSLIWREN